MTNSDASKLSYSDVDYLDAMGIVLWQARADRWHLVDSTKSLNDLEPVTQHAHERETSDPDIAATHQETDSPAIEDNADTSRDQNEVVLSSDALVSAPIIEQVESQNSELISLPTSDQGLDTVAESAINYSYEMESDNKPEEQGIVLKDLIAVESSTINELESQAINEIHSNYSNDYSNYDWTALATGLQDGTICPSCQKLGSILGVGDVNPKWLFISDAPNSQETAQQQLLLGRAGQLFDAILQTLKLTREQVYLSSVFKCPPGTGGEILLPSCDSVLEQQIALLQPQQIVVFGEFSAQLILKSNDNIDQLRSKEHFYQGSNTRVIPTYHPSDLLERGELKALVWQDLQQCL